MNLLDQFGVNPLLLVAQIVNFGIILFALQRFAYKPVLEMLKKRKETIAEGLRQAEESKLLLEQSEEKQNIIIRRAQDQAEKIIQEAKNSSKEFALELDERTRKQAEKILEDARDQISQETREAEKRLATRVNELSISLIETSLKGLFSKKEEEEIIKKALKNIESKN
jgi:F-type H+-transporting ATPase subunit b